DISDQEAMIYVTPTLLPTLRPTFTAGPVVQRTARPTRTPKANGTPQPSPTAARWATRLDPGENRVEMIVLQTSDDVKMGTVKWFQLQPVQAPQECVVFAIRGPMALMLGLFGPGWAEEHNGWTDAMISTRLQEGIDLLSQYCERDKIRVVRVP